MSLILVVEDNRNIALGLQTNLEFEGHQVELAHDGSAGMQLARTGRHDLIILDLMLPSLDGLQLLDTLRQEGLQTPIIVLTARGDEDTKVQALGLGADDYVTKPFGVRELAARVAVRLRRSTASVGEQSADDRPLVCGPLEVDSATHIVRRRGVEIQLRPKEYDLLVYLMRHTGRVATRAELLRSVWGYHDSVQSRTLDTHIKALRRRIEDDPSNPRWLVTVRQTGYRLIPGDAHDL